MTRSSRAERASHVVAGLTRTPTSGQYCLVREPRAVTLRAWLKPQASPGRPENSTLNSERTYEVQGGRGGWISFDDGNREGFLSWEMLLGEVAMVIYEQGSRWVTPVAEPMTPEEVRRHAVAFAKERRLTVEVQFTGRESEVLRGF